MRGFLLFCLVAAGLAAAPAAAAGEGQGAPDPDGIVRIIFIHNSTGIFWLHEDNGGLRPALEDPDQNEYLFEVHDARGVDEIGEYNKVEHWLPKFQTMMDLILAFDESPNIYYSDPDVTNHIVMFKSCYDTSDIVEEGDPPGDPTHWKKTIWNYKAAYLGCAEIFRQHPGVLFIPVTAPPRNKLEAEYAPDRGLNAWAFNDWLTGEFLDDYRRETGLNNIAVFNFFGDVLANPKTHPQYPGALKDIYVKDGSDSHPNEAGNQAATAAFIPFINQAVAEWLGFRAGRHWFRASSAGSLGLHLDAGSALAGRGYAMLGSRSGVDPGMTLNGLHVPLNHDGFTDYTWLHANDACLIRFQGVLDADGRASALLRTFGPVDPRLAGTTIHFASIVGWPVEFASPAVPIRVVP